MIKKLFTRAEGGNYDAMLVLPRENTGLNLIGLVNELTEDNSIAECSSNYYAIACSYEKGIAAKLSYQGDAKLYSMENLEELVSEQASR